MVYVFLGADQRFSLIMYISMEKQNFDRIWFELTFSPRWSFVLCENISPAVKHIKNCFSFRYILLKKKLHADLYLNQVWDTCPEVLVAG
jgi:predicted AlkP superfamily pyrophosphatase or phosphodiesterase